jgi:hypothetical protein
VSTLKPTILFDFDFLVNIKYFKVVKKKSDNFLILGGIAYVLGYSLIGFVIILLVAWLSTHK